MTSESTQRAIRLCHTIGAQNTLYCLLKAFLSLPTNPTMLSERSCTYTELNVQSYSRRFDMGGQPRDPGQQPYPLSPSHKWYVNRYQNPTLFNDVEIERLSGFTWQRFFYFRDKNIAPFVNSPTANGGQRYY